THSAGIFIGKLGLNNRARINKLARGQRARVTNTTAPGNASRQHMMQRSAARGSKRFGSALPKLSPEGYWVGKELRLAKKNIELATERDRTDEALFFDFRQRKHSGCRR